MRQTLSEEGFANIFANFLGQGLEHLLADEPGQVHGVSNLPLGLMEAACNNLRIRADFADAYVLSPEPGRDHHITPEALSERMASNPEAHLVVFVPDEYRDAADAVLSSDFFTPFDTFRGLEGVEQRMLQRINRVPVYKRVATLWNNHALPRLPILKRIDYLVNVISLCLAPEEMGMFFHKLDLIPDRNPDVTGNFSERLARNVICVATLCERQMPPAQRVAALGLTDPVQAERVERLLAGLGDEPTPESLSRAVFEAEVNDAAAELSFEHWRFAGEPA